MSNNLRDLNILITAAGSPSAPGLVKCLKNNGERNIRIIGVDMKKDYTINQIVDELCIAPAATDNNYVDCLLKICKEKKIDVLIPGISQELPKLQERKDEFEKIGTVVSVSDGDGLDIANDKIKLYKFMEKEGFKIPKFVVAHSLTEFINGCKIIGYPDKAFCVKIKNGSGSRGIRIVDPKKSRYDVFINEKPNSFFTTYDDMISILKEAKEFPELMIMDYLPGAEYSVDLLADHGKILYIVGRESNVILASIPQEATTAFNKEAYDISTKIVEKLKLDGNVDLDFKFDENGHPQLMEINPRLAATLSVIKASGVNLLYLRVKQLLGEKLPDVDINYGVKLKRRYHELFCDSEGNPISI